MDSRRDSGKAGAGTGDGMSATPTPEQITALAAEFKKHLVAYIGLNLYEQAIKRNRAEPAGSGICHTHDHCDANQMMLDAFQVVFNREAGDGEFDGDGQWGKDMETINTAWNEWRRANP